MLQYFFENIHKNNKDFNSSSAYLFENLNIMKAGEEYTSNILIRTVIHSKKN